MWRKVALSQGGDAYLESQHRGGWNKRTKDQSELHETLSQSLFPCTLKKKKLHAWDWGCRSGVGHLPTLPCEESWVPFLARQRKQIKTTQAAVCCFPRNILRHQIFNQDRQNYFLSCWFNLVFYSTDQEAIGSTIYAYYLTEAHADCAPKCHGKILWCCHRMMHIWEHSHHRLELTYCKKCLGYSTVPFLSAN